VDKLTRLLSQLLTLARAEAGELPLAYEPIHLTDLCRSVAESLEPVAQAKGVSLTFASVDDVDIMGDRGWMERLLLNLVDNAVKFTLPGGAVAILVTRDGSMVRLVVQDSGVGIPANALPLVFDRFYRVDSAGSLAQDGAGLGLTFVKWIAERHAGTVDVLSREGRGTTFTVSLPIQLRLSQEELC
jgi:signal transduction histidine kinase